MYQIGDAVLYGTQGVCRIAEITQKTLNKTVVEYYVLKPVYCDHSTIYIPVQNAELTGKMRRVLSEEEVSDIIHAMPFEESIWIEDEAERKERYRDIILRGNRMELVKMIKALHAHQQQQQARGKKMHQADERFLKEAEKMLYDEFALVLHIEPNQVLPFIQEQIEVEERKHA